MARVFQLLGRNFEINDEQENFWTIVRLSEEYRNCMLSFALLFQMNIDKHIETNGKLGGRWLELATDSAKTAIEKYAEKVAGFYVEHGIYDISSENIVDDIVEEGFFYESVEKLRERSKKIVESTVNRALSNAAEMNDNTQKRIEQMALNQLDKFFNDPSLFTSLYDALNYDYSQYYKTVGETLEERSDFKIDWITEEQMEEATNISQNLTNPSLTNEVKKDIIFQALDKNIGCSNCYKYIFANFDTSEKKNILKMASFFCVSLNDEINEYLGSMFDISSLETVEVAEECRKKILAEMENLGIEVSGTLHDVKNKICELKQKEFYVNIAACTKESDLDILIDSFNRYMFGGEESEEDGNSALEKKDVECTYKDILLDEDVKKIDNLICEKKDELCTYFGIRFPSQIEANDQRNQHEALLDEINNSTSIADIELIENKISASSLHENIQESLRERAAKALYENELKEYHALIGGSIYTLSVDELAKLKSQVSEHHFRADICNICNSEIYSAEQRIKAEKLKGEFDDLYNANGLKTDVYALTLLIKTTDLLLENCTDEARDMTLTEIRNRYISEMNKIAISPRIQSSSQLAQRKELKVGELIIYSNDPEFNNVPEINDMLSQMSVWEIPVAVVVERKKALILITSESVYCKEHRFLIANGVSLKINSGFFTSKIFISSKDEPTYIKELENQQYLSELKQVVNKTIDDIEMLFEKLYMITADESALNFYAVANKEYSSFSADTVKAIDFLYYCNNSSDLPDIIKNELLVQVLDVIKNKIHGSTADELSNIKAHLRTLAAEKQLDVLAFDNIIAQVELNDNSFNLSTAISSADTDGLLNILGNICSGRYYVTVREELVNIIAQILTAKIKNITDVDELKALCETVKAYDELNNFEDSQAVVKEVISRFTEADADSRTYKGVLFNKAEDISAAKEEEPNMEIVLRSASKMDIDSINAAIEKMNTFQTKLKEHYIGILNGYLSDCEVNSRTYKGVTYDTVEQAKEAEEEFKATREFVRAVDRTDEIVVKEAYEKICGNKYNSSDEIKQELKKLLNEFDTAYRTVDGILFPSRDEADTARTELVAIAELMNAVNADNEPQMIEIRQKISDMSTSVKQKYINSVDKLLADYDVKIRTFNKKVYPTREEAALAKSEFEQITALMETVSPDDEQSIVNAQMAANQMKSDIIAPYKKKLDDMWKALDIKLRTYEKYVYDTREQAQTARVTREKYLNMLNTLDLSQISNIITLENYIEDSLTERFKPEAEKTVNDIKDVNLNAEKVLEDDKTTDSADKKASAALYKLAEKTASRMEKYRMDTTAVKAVMDKHYGSLNAGQKLFSFFKSKL